MAQEAVAFVAPPADNNAGAGHNPDVVAEADVGRVVAQLQPAGSDGRRRGLGSLCPLQKRKRSNRLWSYVEALPRADADGNTHRCLKCGTLLKVLRNSTKSRAFLVTNVKRHFISRHKDVLDMLTDADKAEAAKQPKISTLFKSPSELNDKEKLTQARKAIMRFYVYCPQRISKSTITGAVFREVLDTVAQVPARLRKKLNVSKHTVTKSVDEEAQEFKTLLKRFIADCLRASKGNPFAQGIHDCVTLKNGQKNLAVGISCCSPWHNLPANFCICIGFVPVSSGQAESVASDMRALFVRMTGYTYGAVCHSTMSDFAALSVAGQFGHVREGCAMHGDDKIARYAFGDLQRSRRHRVVEAFDDGKHLLAEAQKCAKYFSYSTRRSMIIGKASMIEGGCPKVVPKTDISTTRVAARYRMLLSILQLNKALRDFTSFPNSTWELSEDDWDSLAEMEAIVRLITETTTMVQTESCQMGAMTHLLHSKLLERLRATNFYLLDLQAITESNTSPRHVKPVTAFTDVGRMCLRRAQLEAERRLCGSTAMRVSEISGVCQVIRSERETLCSVLEPRTLPTVVVKQWDQTTKRKAIEDLRALYVDFFLCAEQPSDEGLVALVLEDAAGNDGRGLLSDDEDDDDNNAAAPAPGLDAWKTHMRHKLETRFNTEFRQHRKWVRDINWTEYGEKHGVSDIPNNRDDIDAFEHLMCVDIMPLIFDMPKHLANIKVMLTHSRAAVCSVPAASFAERINSAGGIVSVKGNVCLAHSEVSNLVPLKINQTFFALLRQRYCSHTEANTTDLTV